MHKPGSTKKPRELNIAEGRQIGGAFPIAPDGATTCAARARAEKWPYECTRIDGHDGPHVAHNPRFEAAAIWQDV